jgi:RNA polymerase sigma-70 factor (ECF subfamily)
VDTLDELLPRLRRGEEAAWGEVHREFYPKLWGTVQRIVDNTATADDVVQETFVKAFRDIGRFQGQSQIGTWLYRIAVNQALDTVRSRQRRAAWLSYFAPVGDDRDPDAQNLIPEGSVPPLVSEGMDREELLKTIEKAISELTPEHRAVVQLRLVDEISLEETAQLLHCKVGTVNSRLHYACKYLQKKLQKSRE